MTWADFYLVCFLVGFTLSLLSFLLGSFHLSLPHAHFHAHLGHLPHVHLDGAHGAGHGAPAAHPSGGHAGLSSAEPEISWFNFGTITAFLAWFGGTGYLLTRYSGLWVWPVLALALAAGVVGASVVLWFLAKLMKHDKALNPMDYEMVGVLGVVTQPIREGGTGEIVFSQEGIRRCTGARSEDGLAIAKQVEVVVTRYDKGIAYVRRWEELANEDQASAKAGKE
jgi:membrane protein implicated in regulation of membrane protease activity